MSAVWYKPNGTRNKPQRVATSLKSGPRTMLHARAASLTRTQRASREALHVILINFTAPRASLLATSLDELLEALQVALNAARHEAERIADILDQTLGVVVHL